MTFFSKLALKLLGIGALVASLAFFVVLPAHAQTGYGLGGGSLWKLVSGALQPLVSTWTIGSSSNRVAAVYATIIDGTTVVIGGASGGGISAPFFTATSTSGGGYRFATNANIDIGTASTTGGNAYMNRYFAATGTAALPGYAFSGINGNSGIYMDASNRTAFSNDGIVKLAIGASLLSYSHINPDTDDAFDLGASLQRWRTGYFTTVSSTRFLAALGSTAAPAYSFFGDEDTGLTAGGAGTINFVTDNNLRMALTYAGTQPALWMNGFGSPTFPNLASSFDTGINSGIYWPNQDQVGVAASGSAVLVVSNNGASSTATWNCGGYVNVYCGVYNNIGAGNAAFQFNYAAGSVSAFNGISTLTGAPVAIAEPSNIGVAIRGSGAAFDSGNRSFLSVIASGWEPKNILEVSGATGQTGNLIAAFPSAASSTPVYVVKPDGGVSTSGTVRAKDGSISEASYTFAGALPSTGIFYNTGGSAVGVGVNGTQVVYFSGSNANFFLPVVPSANNTVDLGLSTNAWRNLYAVNVSSTNATTTQAWITGAPAAGTGLNPFCQGANGQVTVGSAGVCPVSALAFKDVIGETGYGLDELMETTFVDYTFKDELNDGRTHTGPVADWIEKNMPNLVIKDKDGKIVGYDYVSMIGVLGQSIKDTYSRLSSRMDAQDRVIQQQQREIDELKRMIEKK